MTLAGLMLGTGALTLLILGLALGLELYCFAAAIVLVALLYCAVSVLLARRRLSVSLTVDKEEILRHDKKKYVVSPYALLWNDGRYYVPSYDPEKDRIISYRVDRMRNVMPVKERADRRLPFNPAEYSKRVLWMYDGDLEETDVILTAENRHLISLMDRFGPEIPVAQADGEHIRATVRVIPSNTFFSWVFQFGGGIRVAGPAEVKEEYEEMLRKVLEQQGETGEKKHEISG